MAKEDTNKEIAQEEDQDLHLILADRLQVLTERKEVQEETGTEKEDIALAGAEVEALAVKDQEVQAEEEAGAGQYHTERERSQSQNQDPDLFLILLIKNAIQGHPLILKDDHYQEAKVRVKQIEKLPDLHKRMVSGTLKMVLTQRINDPSTNKN